MTSPPDPSQYTLSESTPFIFQQLRDTTKFYRTTKKMNIGRVNSTHKEDAEQGGDQISVFVSYSRADLQAAENLRDSLIAYGFNAYLDKHDILPGEPWQDRLAALIEVAGSVVFLISPASLASAVCDWEVNEAERLGKRILPVILHDPTDRPVPGRLRRLNYIFMRHEDERGAALAQLSDALRTDIKWVREHTRLGGLAGDWDRAGRVPELLLRGTALLAAEEWFSQPAAEGMMPTALHREFVAESRANEAARLESDRAAAEKLETVERHRMAKQSPMASILFGPPAPTNVPSQVQSAIKNEQESSEILVSLTQLLVVIVFGVLYTLSPKAFPPDVPFEPEPVTLALYTTFTLLRFWLAIKRQLRPWFLALSVVVDVALLMITIWSLHLMLQAPAALYLKAPMLMYVFIFIALRALRFDPWFVLLTGVTASLGWLALVGYAVFDDAMQITRDYRVYMQSYSILLGAEFDKIVSIMMVTIIIAIALMRARKVLIRATLESFAATELSDFFTPKVADGSRAGKTTLTPDAD